MRARALTSSGLALRRQGGDARFHLGLRLPITLIEAIPPGHPRPVDFRGAYRGQHTWTRWKGFDMVEGGEQRLRRRHGSLEAAVLQFLRDSHLPRTAGEVRDWLNADATDGLAYTTVVTVLSRLHEKGLLDRVKQGRSFAYLAVADEARLAAQRLKNVLDHGPDREAVLAHFVGDLSPRDAALLRRLIATDPEREAAD
jgi:predicted transcriptional regulator